jgi:hypothetical protein
MSTITEVGTTPQAIEDLAGRVFSEGVGAFHLGTVYIGLKQGLFATLALDGPLTAAELASRTRLDGWYVREWLQAETTAGLLLADDDDPSRARFAAAPGVREALVDETSPAYLGGLALTLPAAFSVMPELLAAFRTGAGVPYASYGEDAVEAQAALNRPAFVNQLVSEWIPQIPAWRRGSPTAVARPASRMWVAALAGPRSSLPRHTRTSTSTVTTATRSQLPEPAGTPPTPGCRTGSPSMSSTPPADTAIAATTWSRSLNACTTWPTLSPRSRRPRQPSPTAGP